MSKLKHKVGDKFFVKKDESCYLIIKEKLSNEYRTTSECDLEYYVSDGTLADAYRKEGDKDIKQVGGNHYSKLKIDPYEYSMVNDLNPLQMNAIKYVTRYNFKNGIEDLEKAIHTINRLIEFEKSKL